MANQSELIKEIAKNFRGNIIDNFQQLDRESIIILLAEVFTDSAFLLCESNENLMKIINDTIEKNSH